MTDRTALIALLLVAATGLVSVAAAAPAGPGAVDAPVGQANATDTVNVSVGAQLSTVIETRTQEVRTDVEDADFEFDFESGDPDEAVAERAEELREDAADVREEYHELTAEYEAGEITRDEFARRIATLNDRAERIRGSLDRVRSRADRELAAASFNESRLREIALSLQDVSGAGPDALLQRFTGQSTGEVELRLANGLRIEVESEDGERSREIRRTGDDSLALTVGQDEALSTARQQLSTDVGTWTLVEATVHEDDGEYRFEFELSTPMQTGETEIRVDGSSGDVVRFEEEIEPRDADDDDAEDEADDEQETPEDDERETPEDDEQETPEDDEQETPEDDEQETPEDDEQETPDATTTPEPEMDLAVSDGTPGPGETITVRVTIDGTAAADIPVAVDGDTSGRTGTDGTLTLTLPDEDDVRVRAESDDLDAALRFDFDD